MTRRSPSPPRKPSGSSLKPRHSRALPRSIPAVRSCFTAACAEWAGIAVRSDRDDRAVSIGAMGPLLRERSDLTVGAEMTLIQR